MDESKDLVGVGGWLATFIVILAVISPIRLLVSTWIDLYGDPGTAAAFEGDWPAIQACEWTIAAVAVAISWFLAWRLIRVHAWSSVRLTIAGIWTLAFGIQLADLIGVSLIGGFPLGDMMQAVVPSLLQPVVFSTVWTTYLLRSRRVANTYPRYGAADELAGVFG
jgi:hypothetical protein